MASESPYGSLSLTWCDVICESGAPGCCKDYSGWTSVVSNKREEEDLFVVWVEMRSYSCFAEMSPVEALTFPVSRNHSGVSQSERIPPNAKTLEPYSGRIPKRKQTIE